MIKVCAYCRVSTDSKDQVNSFENQQLYFNRELSRNPKFEFVDIYADKGISGTKLRRTEFDRMLYDAGLDILEVSNESRFTKYVTLPSDREPKFKYIYVKNTSRFARNVEVESIFRDLAKKEVYVYFLDLMKSTENESDRTYIQIFCSFDERESRDKRNKVLFGFAEGNNKGVIRTNSKIYGYSYIRSENRLEVIKDEAEVVKLIFELYSENYGIRKIINYLDANNIKTRNGKRFAKTTISKILDNEKYAGLRNNMKYKLGNDLFDKFSSPKRKEDNEYEVEESVKIPAIISQELFYKCRNLRYSKVNYQNQKGVKKATSKYAYKVFCDNCHELYNSNVDRGRRFYNCKTKKKYGTNRCNNPNVSEKNLDAKLHEFFEEMKTGFFFENVTNDIYAMCRIIIEHEDLHGLKVKKLIDKQDELLAELKTLYDLYAKRVGSQELLEKEIADREKIISNLKKDISKMNDEDDTIVNKVLSLYSYIEKINEIFDKIQSEEDILDYIRFLIREDGEISIDFSIYFEAYKMFVQSSHVAYDTIFDDELDREHQSYLAEIEKTKSIVIDFVNQYS